LYRVYSHEVCPFTDWRCSFWEPSAGIFHMRRPNNFPGRGGQLLCKRKNMELSRQYDDYFICREHVAFNTLNSKPLVYVFANIFCLVLYGRCWFDVFGACPQDQTFGFRMGIDHNLGIVQDSIVSADIYIDMSFRAIARKLIRRT